MATLSAWRARAAAHKAVVLGTYKNELACKQQAIAQFVEISTMQVRQSRDFRSSPLEYKKMAAELDKLHEEVVRLQKKIKHLENPKKKRTRF